MISEDDQFHHLERIGPRKRGSPNIYHEATLGLQFLTSFPHSKKSTYISNWPKFPYAVHFPSQINAESADTRTMAVSLSIPEFDLL